jgi:hypothetical protein
MSEIAKLQALGIDTERLSAEQQSVLTALSPEELNVLGDVKRRLETAGGDVQAHSDDGIGDGPGVIIF